jgi:hypothetical protein
LPQFAIKSRKWAPKIIQSYFNILRATFLLWKVLEVYFDLCLFFSWVKINFAFQKPLADFFLVEPWPLQQPPKAKVLISVRLLKGHKISFKCKLSYELQFAELAWDLTNFYSKETRIVENASLCSGVLASVWNFFIKFHWHGQKLSNINQ